MASVAALGDRLADCGNAGAHTGFGGGAGTDEPEEEQTFLVLELETLQGAGRIVGMTAIGAASPTFLACADGQLRGLVVAARDASPGQRMRLVLPIGSERATAGRAAAAGAGRSRGQSG